MAFKLVILFTLLVLSFLTSQIASTSKRHVASQIKNTSKRDVVKTIRVKDGDIIDCIDIYKQPAFNHPALKNHTIQMKSTHLESRKDLQKSNSPKVPLQVWQQYGSCPNGTIPIRRSTPAKDHPSSSKIIINPGHSFSVVLTEGFSYSGAKANIKVWNPYVESNGDYSTSQVMLRSGPIESFDTAQAGWAVNPGLYYDNKTRLFAYWTVDGMKNTGCFDLTCPGFFQTSPEIVLGGDITSYYGSEITIQISKDPYTDNWWLKYNDKEVGYWPAEIFLVMRNQAHLVQWGGEVCSPNVGTQPHTSTGMGSGRFSDFIFRRSGTMTGMLIEENSNPLKQPEPETLYVSSDEWNCYDAYLLKEGVPEPVFFYGGPGSRQNRRCP
ncbi:hypothetical protein OSB04_030987 [Centaurea solstitialis]|uniref:Neprosin PEP catalytic domain-containing protein n=1 Tax=Centaurea solstitialis TaxID=347529 RepID=A0AA38S9V9_9ASTR|nr:hypothetical protein OSB04_030987 [Centaurea solstitialis]